MYLGQLERMWFLSVHVKLVCLSSKIMLVCLYFLLMCKQNNCIMLAVNVRWRDLAC